MSEASTPEDPSWTVTTGGETAIWNDIDKALSHVRLSFEHGAPRADIHVTTLGERAEIAWIKTW